MAITDPRDISGLLAWYSAEAETGYADGDQMTSWTDLSGLGNDATAVAGSGGSKPLWKSALGPSSGAAIRFQSTNQATDGGYFTLPNVLAGATSGEALIYAKADSGINTSLWRISTAADSSHYPFSVTVYENFGRSTRYTFNPTVSITSWRRYGIYASATDSRAYLDEVEQVNAGGATVVWPTSPQIGRDSYGFGGYVSAFVLYNRKLTTTERADLAAWLAANPSGGTAAAPPASSTISLAGVLPGVVDSLTLSTFTDTATANRSNGRLRGGRFVDESEEPVEPLPAGLVRAVKVDKALAYPTPTLVDGRPT